MPAKRCKLRRGSGFTNAGASILKVDIRTCCSCGRTLDDINHTAALTRNSPSVQRAPRAFRRLRYRKPSAVLSPLYTLKPTVDIFERDCAVVLRHALERARTPGGPPPGVRHPSLSKLVRLVKQASERCQAALLIVLLDVAYALLRIRSLGAYAAGSTEVQAA